MTPAGFAEYLTSELGWPVTPEAVEYWEGGDGPPSEVQLAADSAVGAVPGGAPLLDAVPHSFPAGALAGHWVTAYQFTHGDRPMHHADIAYVEAESARNLRASNYPPEPRTEGRALAFRNEIEAALFSRHVIGHWRNISDARYFGSVHLAVLPGETVMDGYYTGFASDIGVSLARWKWVRLGPASPPEDLSTVTLREAAAVYELVMNHSQDDAPLALADVREEAA
jgi:hypothetical protein